MIPPKLLNQTLDSLYLRLFSCSPPSAWLSSQIEKWREYKENYDYSGQKLYIDLPLLGKFQLLYVGHTPYEFVLTNPEIGDIRLFNPHKFIGKAAIQTGQIYLDFRSKYLQCQTDDYGLIDQFIENTFDLFFQTKSNHWAKVSRADLAADFLGVDFQWSDLTKLCTRSRKKDGLTSFCSISDLQTVLDLLSSSKPQTCNKGGCNDSSQEFHTIKLTQSQLNILVDLTSQAVDDPTLSRAIFQKDLQTAYIGRFGSKIYARIYTKSAEIKISGKDYLESFWKEKGWQEGQKVTRVEFSLSGDFLNEFWATDDNSQHWQNFRDNFSQIWTYCTSNWLRHTTGENSLNSRSPNSEFWDCVQTAFLPDHNFCRLPLPAPPTESLAGQLIKQGKGCFKTVAALIFGGFHKAFGYDQQDQKELLRVMLTELGNELHEDISFADIEERRDRYGCDEFSDTEFSHALRKHRMKLGVGS
jgi:hypothetical protein